MTANFDEINTLIFWTKSASDTRHTASGVGHIEIPASVNAARIARMIDAGDVEKVAKKFPDAKQYNLPSAAVGHGVCVQYANGRRRMVRAYND